MLEYVIKEFGVPTACQDDFPHFRTKTCYVRVLKTTDGDLVDCNGCDDLHGGEPCQSCINAVIVSVRERMAQED